MTTKHKPLGKQVHNVLVGRFVNGDIGIQTKDGFVRISKEDAADLPAAIMLAIASK